MRNVLAMASLALPLIVLASLTGFHKYNEISARRFIIPIEGYDPRDALRGQYLQFNYVWPANIGTDIGFEEGKTKSLCLDGSTADALTAKPIVEEYEDCKYSVILWQPRKEKYAYELQKTPRITGRFYLPENRAKTIERALFDTRYKMSVSATIDNGKLVPRELLVNGQPWQDVDLSDLDVSNPALSTPTTYTIAIKPPTSCVSPQAVIFDYDWSTAPDIAQDQNGIAREARGFFGIYEQNHKSQIATIADVQKMLESGQYRFEVKIDRILPPDSTKAVYPNTLLINQRPWREMLDEWRKSQQDGPE